MGVLSPLITRRQFMVGAGASGLGLVAGCGRLPWQPEPPKTVRLGSLWPGPRSPAMDSLLQRLRELGYEEGQNLIIERRFAEDREERLPELAAELVRVPVDVIYTSGSPATFAAKEATSTIPIVFTDVGDPAGIGLVASLGRPGGNVTGLSNYSSQLAAKQLELLTVAVPAATRVAVLWNGANPGNAVSWRNASDAATALGVEALSLEVQAATGLDN